jgi:hypothetical protein
MAYCFNSWMDGLTGELLDVWKTALRGKNKDGLFNFLKYSCFAIHNFLHISYYVLGSLLFPHFSAVSNLKLSQSVLEVRG